MKKYQKQFFEDLKIMKDNAEYKSIKNDYFFSETTIIEVEKMLEPIFIIKKGSFTMLDILTSIIEKSSLSTLERYKLFKDVITSTGNTIINMSFEDYLDKIRVQEDSIKSFLESSDEYSSEEISILSIIISKQTLGSVLKSGNRKLIKIANYILDAGNFKQLFETFKNSSIELQNMFTNGIEEDEKEHYYEVASELDLSLDFVEEMVPTLLSIKKDLKKSEERKIIRGKVYEATKCDDYKKSISDIKSVYDMKSKKVLSNLEFEQISNYINLIGEVYGEDEIKEFISSILSSTMIDSKIKLLLILNNLSLYNDRLDEKDIINIKTYVDFIEECIDDFSEYRVEIGKFINLIQSKVPKSYNRLIASLKK